MKVKELIGELAKCENIDTDVRVWDGDFGVHLAVVGAKLNSYDLAGRKPVVELYVNPLKENFSAPPASSKLEERFNKLRKYWETLDLKDTKLTEYGKGIDDVVGYLTTPDDISVNTYLDTIKSESVEKKKYRVEVERGIRYVIEVEASSKDEAENLAVDKAAPMKPLKDDSNWYDCGLGDLVIFSEEVKE